MGSSSVPDAFDRSASLPGASATPSAGKGRSGDHAYRMQLQAWRQLAAPAGIGSVNRYQRPSRTGTDGTSITMASLRRPEVVACRNTVLSNRGGTSGQEPRQKLLPSKGAGPRSAESSPRNVGANRDLVAPQPAEVRSANRAPCPPAANPRAPAHPRAHPRLPGRPRPRRVRTRPWPQRCPSSRHLEVARRRRQVRGLRGAGVGVAPRCGVDAPMFAFARPPPGCRSACVM